MSGHTTPLCETQIKWTLRGWERGLWNEKQTEKWIYLKFINHFIFVQK